MTERVCRVCGLSKPLSLLVKDKKSLHGCSTLCHQCKNDRRSELRRQNPKFYRDLDRKHRLQHIESRRKIDAESKAKNPEKVKARRAVRDAIKRDEMSPPSACECNDCRASPAVHLHHHSYEPKHWLDVVPLCNACHVLRHKTPSIFY